MVCDDSLKHRGGDTARPLPFQGRTCVMAIAGILRAWGPQAEAGVKVLLRVPLEAGSVLESGVPEPWPSPKSLTSAGHCLRSGPWAHGLRFVPKLSWHKTNINTQIMVVRWDTFHIFAYCGLVGNPHLTAKQYVLLPFQRQAKNGELLPDVLDIRAEICLALGAGIWCRTPSQMRIAWRTRVTKGGAWLGLGLEGGLINRSLIHGTIIDDMSH